MLSSIETYQYQSYVYCVVQPEVIKTLGNEIDTIEHKLKEINIINAPRELELKLNQFAL